MGVTLDKYLDDGKGILEIEALTRSKKDFTKAEAKIDKIFWEWGITPLNKEGFVEFVKYINNKKYNFFDLSKGGVEKYIRLWKNKFS